MMKRTTLFLVLFAMGACDTEAEPLDETRAFAAEVDEEAESDVRSRGHHGRGHHGFAGKVCEVVECTDDQRAQVKAAMGMRDHEERPERPDMSEANAALATAFAGEGFSAADLEAWRKGLPERPEWRAHKLEAMSELHTILTAEQRATLAETIAAGELMGRRHHRGDDAKHVSRRVDRVCERLECSDSQKEQLVAVLEAAHERRSDREEGRKAMAEAFASDTFDVDALPRHEHRPEIGRVLVEVHGLLTPEQRAMVAERIAEHGPRAFMGKHGRHGKRRGHHRRGGGLG
jgi:Spy/CpxP family protein refolding chaperone